MKLAFLLLAYSGIGIYSLSYSEQILVNWRADEMENSTINIFMGEDGFIYGKIVASDQKEWIGEVVLKGVSYDTDIQVWMGEVYSLKRKITIDVTISLASASRLKLVGRKLLMTKTVYLDKWCAQDILWSNECV